jgi:hypothetical protein
VPGAATDRAAAPIFAVIEAVVFGLMTRRRMLALGRSHSFARRRRRTIAMLVIATMMMTAEKAVVSVPSA